MSEYSTGKTLLQSTMSSDVMEVDLPVVSDIQNN